MSVRRLTLVVTAVAAAAVLASACAGGGGGDDDDDGASPTPPFEADRCQIVWQNEIDPARRDLYLLDAPVGSWVLSSDLRYSVSGTGFRAIFVAGFDLAAGTWDTQAIATSGSFALVLEGTDAGRVLGFEDGTPQPFAVLDSAGAPGAIAGTGGTGFFDGFWSDPYSQNVLAGDGEVTLTVDGTSRTLGVDLSYAVCYKDEDVLFRPDSRVVRIPARRAP